MIKEKTDRYGLEFKRLTLTYKTEDGQIIKHIGLHSHKDAVDIAKKIPDIKLFTVKQSKVMILKGVLSKVEWANAVAENSDGVKYDCLIIDDNLNRIEMIDDED